jgi:hypothetical protein
MGPTTLAARSSVTPVVTKNLIYLSDSGSQYFKAQIADMATTKRLADSLVSTTRKRFDWYCPEQCVRSGGEEYIVTMEKLSGSGGEI